MSEHQPASPLSSLHHYAPPAGVFDELGRGQLTAHWQGIMQFFADAGFGGETPQPEQIRAEMLVRDLDVERPTRLDPIPFAVSSNEWQQLEQGLVQRARLLNAITSDLYGQRALLQPDALPPALVFGNPRFLLPMYQCRAYQEEYLQLLAFDVGRSPDGQWRVLADWTEAPAGMGMCLENRILAAQALPEIFQQENTQRLASFFRAYSGHLTNIARNTTVEGITVILSPGPAHPYYFEQAYLGQYFGFPVVEGADLTIRGDTLHLKTLEGLKPVGCVVRHVVGDQCDQLYLDSHGTDGVPGLTNIARQGNAHIANALGAGALENDAFMSFLPGLSHTLLGEELQLPSLATWWCGQSAESAYVAQHQHELHCGPAFQRPELFAGAMRAFEQTATPASWNDEQAYLLVGRELIKLSHAPYIGGDGNITSGPVALRLFVAMTDTGYRLMPGGIARVATPEGEVSKDIWINSEAASAIPDTQAQPAGMRRSDRDLPSRTADDLFWLGRYLERCEGAVRVYRCLFSHISEGTSEERLLMLRTVTQLLVDLEMLTPQQARQLAEAGDTPMLAREWWSMLFSPESDAGLFALLSDIHRLANQVRERLSADAWRMFNNLAQTPDRQRWRLTNVGAALSLMDRLIERLSGLNGQIQENMTRSYGWRLLELGRRLERGQFGLQVLSELVSHSTSGTYMYLLLDLSDSTITYRARYQNTPVLENLLHLLLLDETNPRSMIYQIERLQAVMKEMPLEQDLDGMSEAQLVLLSAYHELLLSEPGKMANVISKAGNRTQLRRVLARLDTTLSSLSELVTAAYFAHTHNIGGGR